MGRAVRAHDHVYVQHRHAAAVAEPDRHTGPDAHAYTYADADAHTCADADSRRHSDTNPDADSCADPYAGVRAAPALVGLRGRRARAGAPIRPRAATRLDLAAPGSLRPAGPAAVSPGSVSGWSPFPGRAESERAPKPR